MTTFPRLGMGALEGADTPAVYVYEVGGALPGVALLLLQGTCRAYR